MNIYLSINTSVDAVIACDNEPVKTNKRLLIADRDFPLQLNMLPVNKSVQVHLPLSVEVKFDGKQISCESPYVKSLYWGDKTWQLFVNFPKHQPFNLPRPVAQKSLIHENKQYLFTLHQDNQTRLLCECEDVMEFYDFPLLEKPILNANVVNNCVFASVSSLADGYHAVATFTNGKCECPINGYFKTFELSNALLTKQINDDLSKHETVSSYMFTQKGLQLVEQSVVPTVEVKAGDFPLAFFEALKMKQEKELSGFLCEDLRTVSMQDLSAYFMQYDSVCVPTLVNRPNCVALIDTEQMKLCFVKLSFQKDGLISNFEIINAD